MEHQQNEQAKIIISGAITNNGGTITGNIINPVNYYGKNMDGTSTKEKVKKMLKQIFEEKLVTDKTQWYAIYRFLTDKYIAPRKPEDFESYISSLEMEFPIPCDKAKYKNVASTCTRLKVDIESWPDITAPSTAESGQIIVAKRLLELIG